MRLAGRESERDSRIRRAPSPDLGPRSHVPAARSGRNCSSHARSPMQAPLPIAPGPEPAHAPAPRHEPSATASPLRKAQAACAVATFLGNGAGVQDTGAPSDATGRAHVALVPIARVISCAQAPLGTPAGVAGTRRVLVTGPLPDRPRIFHAGAESDTAPLRHRAVVEDTCSETQAGVRVPMSPVFAAHAPVSWRRRSC